MNREPDHEPCIDFDLLKEPDGVRKFILAYPYPVDDVILFAVEQLKQQLKALTLKVEPCPREPANKVLCRLRFLKQRVTVPSPSLQTWPPSRRMSFGNRSPP